MWCLLTLIYKQAYVSFHVAAHHFVQSCKSNCHVLNAIHLKYFVIELPCFKCNTSELQKYRITESYATSVALVVQQWGLVDGSNNPV